MTRLHSERASKEHAAHIKDTFVYLYSLKLTLGPSCMKYARKSPDN